MEETRKSTQLKAGEMILLAIFAAVIVGALVLTAVGALMPEQKPGEAPEMSASQMAEAGDAALLDYWSAESEQTDSGAAEEADITEQENALMPHISEQETTFSLDTPEAPVSRPERETNSGNYGGTAEVVDTQSLAEWTEGWD